DLIKPIIQKENQYSQGVRGMSRTFNYPRAKGKYLALCEGDDYWIDPLKLQKQVDFLEAHDDYSVTVGGFKTIQNGEIVAEKVLSNLVAPEKEDDKGFTFDLMDTRKAWMTKTLTSVFRNLPEVNEKYREFHYSRDLHLFYFLLKEGKGYYFKSPLGVYNQHGGGVYSTKSSEDKFLLNFYTYEELYKKTGDEVARLKYFDKCTELLQRK